MLWKEQSKLLVNSMRFVWYLFIGLRLARSNGYLKPRLRTKLGKSAFSFSCPAEWNSLSSERTAGDYGQFYEES